MLPNVRVRFRFSSCMLGVVKGLILEYCPLKNKWVLLATNWLFGDEMWLSFHFNKSVTE